MLSLAVIRAEFRRPMGYQPPAIGGGSAPSRSRPHAGQVPVRKARGSVCHVARHGASVSVIEETSQAKGPANELGDQPILTGERNTARQPLDAPIE
jgi:hypothetical protein